MLCAFVPAVKGGKETRDIQPEREGGGEEGEGMVRGGNHLQRMARSGGRTGEMKRERGRLRQKGR